MEEFLLDDRSSNASVPECVIETSNPSRAFIKNNLDATNQNAVGGFT
jgi:hypothetical protein